LKILESLKGTALLVVALGALLAGCDGSDGSAATASAASEGTTPQASNTLMTRGTSTSVTTAPEVSEASSGNATLSWEAPVSNTNGSALTDLAGYRIYYGASADDMKETVQISNVGIQTYVIENLEAGTWYFAVRALSSEGTESPLSDVVSKRIG
jgi:hypothetical protein